MASQYKSVSRTAIWFLWLMAVQLSYVRVAEALWCVARSDASSSALQTALDYACAAGADCAPIQPSGLCYLPNTLQAHASYAFNSFFQRKANAPDSCNFGGTATAAQTDPSYGSCVYPPNPSTAGGGTTPGIGGTTPGAGIGGTTPNVHRAPPTSPFSGNNGGLTPGLGPVTVDTNNAKACLELSMLQVLVLLSCSLLVLQFIYV